jgi:hypothetical protein
MFFNRRMCHAYHTRASYSPALLAMQSDYRAGRIPHSALLALQLFCPPLMSNELAAIARHLKPNGALDEMSEWWLFSQPPRCQKIAFDPVDWREIVNLQGSLATASTPRAWSLHSQLAEPSRTPSISRVSSMPCLRRRTLRPPIRRPRSRSPPSCPPPTSPPLLVSCRPSTPHVCPLYRSAGFVRRRSSKRCGGSVST